MNKREGGCLCGAVRYNVAWPPINVATCSCKNCQKQSGANLSIIAIIAADTFELTGELSSYTDLGESGNKVFRKFCARCGSPILSELEQPASPDMIFLKAGTLDITNDVAPTMHFWTSSAPDWMLFPEGDMKLEKQS